MIIQALQIWNDHSLLREGCRNVVYLDSLKKPTGGIGHLIRPEDNMKVGDKISDEKIEMWFALDTADALATSLKQWKEIGHYTAEFLAALISVNYQLGDFSKKFPNTYALIKKRNISQAIANLRSRGKDAVIDTWFEQTPTRVEDFINALRRIK